MLDKIVDIQDFLLIPGDIVKCRANLLQSNIHIETGIAVHLQIMASVLYSQILRCFISYCSRFVIHSKSICNYKPSLSLFLMFWVIQELESIKVEIIS